MALHVRVALGVWASVMAIAACGGPREGAPDPVAPTPTVATASTQIITQKTEGTVAELRQRADHALMQGNYKAAIEPLEALRVAEPNARVLLDLGTAYEAVAQRDQAKAIYAELREKYRTSEEARTGLLRHANLAAYTESWAELATLADAILKLSPLDDVAKMVGLGARAVARIEAGDDTLAARDVQDGLDLMDATHYGASGRLPVAAAQLKFAQAEVRRVRSEKIIFKDLPTEAFMGKFEARCTLLMDAQGAFTDAIRSEDPRWAAMSGYRVGEMYRTLHRDLMAIPPTKGATTKDKQQLFYAMMHVRYRVLLEKGSDMMTRTIGLGEKLNDASAWLEKARATKADIEKAIAEEQKTIATLPYTEEEVQKALNILKRKVLEKEDQERQKQLRKTP